eukprot:TRINITY_DN1852_c1_g1_i10.p1 TRINITY_DN1852_c1_g1~~TRINITY_DN1852_c1_g1_i10.p1  ORF type:complete len:331 (-),score=-32.09 TRINITY_DN1852_c1_g1_i10:467-1459(-)
MSLNEGICKSFLHAHFLHLQLFFEIQNYQFFIFYFNFLTREPYNHGCAKIIIMSFYRSTNSLRNIAFKKNLTRITVCKHNFEILKLSKQILIFHYNFPLKLHYSNFSPGEFGKLDSALSQPKDLNEVFIQLIISLNIRKILTQYQLLILYNKGYKYKYIYKFQILTHTNRPQFISPSNLESNLKNYNFKILVSQYTYNGLEPQARFVLLIKPSKGEKKLKKKQKYKANFFIYTRIDILITLSTKNSLLYQLGIFKKLHIIIITTLKFKIGSKFITVLAIFTMKRTFSPQYNYHYHFFFLILNLFFQLQPRFETHSLCYLCTLSRANLEQN